MEITPIDVLTYLFLGGFLLIMLLFSGFAICSLPFLLTWATNKLIDKMIGIWNTERRFRDDRDDR